MSAAEVLVRKLLELAGDDPTRGWTLALAGPGLEELPDRVTTASGAVAVTRPTTEVELRYQLWQANGAPLLAIVPHELALRLPPDLVRPARGACVLSLDVSEVLSVVLGAPVTATDDVGTSELALEYLDALQKAVKNRTVPTVIDRRTLDELLLDVTVGSRIRTEKPGALLADWVRTKPDWPAAVRNLVVRSLPSLHATEGSVLAWALDTASLRAIVIHGTLLAIDAEVADAVWGPLAAARQTPTLKGLGDEVLRRSFGELARQALAVLPPAHQAPLLQEAESIARRVLTPRDQAKSDLLPLGLDVRCAAVAKSAGEGKVIANTDLRWMRDHRAAALYRAELDLLEPMARLSRWIATEETALGDDVLAHVRGYQRDGAFADVAAAQIRRALSGTTRFEREARTLLAMWEARRNRMNLAFAERLARGYVDALHGDGLIGVHTLWQEYVNVEAERAKRATEPERSKSGIYLVVLDGCSYPAFLEILEELASDAGLPIGLMSEADGAYGQAATSILPSITSHARGAIFLGQIPKDPWLSEVAFREGERTTDPGRFRQNPKLGTATRRLFLKNEVSGGPTALVSAIDDPAMGVVAAVFNAIDDQIGSSNTGAVVTIRGRDIVGLVPSLRAALRAKRTVVITADHGHTPFLGSDHKVGMGEAPRFAELTGNAPVPDGFLEIDLAGLGGSRARRAFAWKMGAYLGLPQAGFHGGCSLEEMVIPLAVVVERGVPADRPVWWEDAGFAVEQTSATPVPPAEPTRRKPSKKPSDAQLLLLDGSVSLGLDDHILAIIDEDERRAITVLARVGSARQQELAAALGRNAGRIGGFMTVLHRKLRNAQVENLRIERLPSGEQSYHWAAGKNGR